MVLCLFQRMHVLKSGRYRICHIGREDVANLAVYVDR